MFRVFRLNILILLQGVIVNSFFATYFGESICKIGLCYSSLLQSQKLTALSFAHLFCLPGCTKFSSIRKLSLYTQVHVPPSSSTPSTCTYESFRRVAYKIYSRTAISVVTVLHGVEAIRSRTLYLKTADQSLLPVDKSRPRSKWWCLAHGLVSKCSVQDKDVRNRKL